MGTGGMRGAFSFVTNNLSLAGKRAWNSFYYEQYHRKPWIYLALPLVLFTVKGDNEDKYGYHVFITDEEILPSNSKKIFDFKNGEKHFFDEATTVADLKKHIYLTYGDNIPENVAVGCRGRMFEETDNLALGVRAFCKRDPRITFWKE
eukprot:GDKJ01036512.1.p1 GENE.GDKJ01036512.1~~GDKJ01036512.1.p1  ORF type:complete len:148 (-),score=29.56 GDKJ01036512.1:71-514(-)